jgi:hypothetical protein
MYDRFLDFVYVWQTGKSKKGNHFTRICAVCTFWFNELFDKFCRFDFRVNNIMYG